MPLPSIPSPRWAVRLAFLCIAYNLALGSEWYLLPRSFPDGAGFAQLEGKLTVLAPGQKVGYWTHDLATWEEALPLPIRTQSESWRNTYWEYGRYTFRARVTSKAVKFNVTWDIIVDRYLTDESGNAEVLYSSVNVNSPFQPIISLDRLLYGMLIYVKPSPTWSYCGYVRQSDESVIKPVDLGAIWETKLLFSNTQNLYLLGTSVIPPTPFQAD